MRAMLLSDSSIWAWTLLDIDSLSGMVSIYGRVLLRLVVRHDNDVDVDEMPLPWKKEGLQWCFPFVLTRPCVG